MFNKLKKYKGFKFVLPSFIGFLLLYIVPFFGGFKVSFSKTAFNKGFVGFTNYLYVLDSSAFQLAAKNTALFMIIAFPLIIVLSFFLALCIYELNISKVIKLFIVIPIAIPSAAVAGFFKRAFGVTGWNLLDSEYALFVVILIFLWKNTGYNLIIYLAGMSQINKSAIEAASIDGANYLEKLRYIIIPLLTPTTVIVGIITIINSFKVFKDILMIQGRYPNPKIYMLQHYLTNKYLSLKYHHLTAAAYIFTLVILAIVFLFLLMDRKYAKKVGEK
ncbi:MAG: sugar ABC transporter permease [Firmicutes bacterium]|nr:sugar ABC transporter permease [Bacillota bacterium]